MLAAWLAALTMVASKPCKSSGHSTADIMAVFSTTVDCDSTIVDCDTLRCLQGNPVFLEQVTLWQRKLGTVDVVLNTWSDVQRKWQALESIFIGSADIRVQLPADSARFDTLNVEFKARSAA